MKKRLISVILSAIFIVTPFGSAFAEMEQTADVIFCSDFNSEKVGSAPKQLEDGWAVTANGNAINVSARADENGNCIQLLPVYGSAGGPYIQISETLDETFILEGSVKIVNHKGCSPRLVHMSTSSGESAVLLNIDASGNLINIQGMSVGKLKDDAFTKFSLVVFPETKTYDIYINNRRTGTNVEIPVNGKLDFTRWRIQAASITEGCTTQLYLDDLALYQTNNQRPVLEGNLNEMSAGSFDESLQDGFLYVMDTPRMLRRGYVVDFVSGEDGLYPVDVEGTPYIPLRYSAGMFDNSSVVWENGNGGYARVTVGGKSMEARPGVNSMMLGSYMLIDANVFAELVSKNMWYDKKTGILFLSDRESGFDWVSNKELLDEGARKIVYDNPSADKIRSDFSAHMSKGEHPRIIFDKEGLDKLLTNVKTSEVMKGYAEDVIKSAENYAKAEPTKYDIPDGLRLYAACEDARVRICYLAMAYLLCDDAETKAYYAEKVWEETENVCVSWKDWNPYHFLDTGAMASGVAIAYDWLYDYWTPERKAVMEEALYNRGVREILKDLLDEPRERKNNYWLDLENNWTLLCVGGVGIGALAIADIDKYTDDCSVMLEKGLFQMQRSLKEYGPDGGFLEGTSYWGMATEHFARLVDSLIASCGSDYGLLEAPGIRETGYFPLAMVGPGGSYNFSDSSGGVSRAVLFFARHNRDSALQAAYAFYEEAQKLTGSVDVLLWYTPEYDAVKAETETSHYYRYLETVTMRDIWNMNSGNFIGFHVGNNDVSHAHFDTGSFVLDMNGKRFALDLGPGNYNDAGGFYRYRYSAEGHNTWVINPDSSYTQSETAFCPVKRYETNAYEGYAISDITEAYSGKIQSLVRGVFATEKRKVFVVQDELDNGSTPFEGYWQMHTTADIDILEGGKQAILTIDDDCVLVSLLTDNDAVFEVMECEPFPSTPKYASTVSDIDKKKLVLHLTGCTKETVAVEFQHFYRGETPPTLHTTVKPLTQWRLNEIKEEWTAEPPTLTAVTINGVPLEGFNSKNKNYNISMSSQEIKNLEIKAEADENSSVTVEYPAEYPGTVKAIASKGMLREVYSIRITPQYDISQFADAQQLKIYDVEATAEPQPENPKGNAIDGDYSTRWSASGYNSLTFDLGSPKNVDYISLAYYNGSARTSYFEVETSADGVEWTVRIRNGETSLTDSDQYFPVTAEGVRYIRVNCRGTSVSPSGWNSVTEFKAFGK